VQKDLIETLVIEEETFRESYWRGNF